MPTINRPPSTKRIRFKTKDGWHVGFFLKDANKFVRNVNRWKDTETNRWYDGDVFEWNDEVYMKICESDGDNAVVVRTGEVECFDKDELVTPIPNAKLVIGEE